MSTNPQSRLRWFGRAGASSMLAFAALMSGPMANAADCDDVFQTYEPRTLTKEVRRYIDTVPEYTIQTMQSRTEYYVTPSYSSTSYLVQYPIRVPYYFIETRNYIPTYDVQYPIWGTDYEFRPFWYDEWLWNWIENKTHVNHFRRNAWPNDVFDVSCINAWNDRDPDCGGHGHPLGRYLGHDTYDNWRQQWNHYNFWGNNGSFSSGYRIIYGDPQWNMNVPPNAQRTGNSRRTPWPLSWTGTTYGLTQRPWGAEGTDYRIVGQSVILPNYWNGGYWSFTKPNGTPGMTWQVTESTTVLGGWTAGNWGSYPSSGIQNIDWRIGDTSTSYYQGSPYWSTNQYAGSWSQSRVVNYWGGDYVTRTLPKGTPGVDYQVASTRNVDIYADDYVTVPQDFQTNPKDMVRNQNTSVADPTRSSYSRWLRKMRIVDVTGNTYRDAQGILRNGPDGRDDSTGYPIRSAASPPRRRVPLWRPALHHLRRHRETARFAPHDHHS